jgi:hypothetical protein
VKGCTQRFLFGLSRFDQPITKKQKKKMKKERKKKNGRLEKEHHVG